MLCSIGFDLSISVGSNISWNNPFPGLLAFKVYLNSSLVFETETETSYPINSSNGEVCVVAQDKLGSSKTKCESLIQGACCFVYM